MIPASSCRRPPVLSVHIHLLPNQIKSSKQLFRLRSCVTSPGAVALVPTVRKISPEGRSMSYICRLNQQEFGSDELDMVIGLL